MQAAKADWRKYDESRPRLVIRLDREEKDAQLDPDVKQWFQAQGEQYKTLINSVLRQYIESTQTQRRA